MTSINLVSEYLRIMESTEAKTLDEVVTAGFPGSKEEARQCAELLNKVANKLAGREALVKSFQHWENVQIMNRMISFYNSEFESLKNDVGKESDGKESAFKHKELVDAITRAVTAVQKLTEQNEALHDRYVDRQSVVKIFQLVFKVLDRTDPVVASRCRQAVLAGFDELSIVLDGHA